MRIYIAISASEWLAYRQVDSALKQSSVARGGLCDLTTLSHKSLRKRNLTWICQLTNKYTSDIINKRLIYFQISNIHKFWCTCSGPMNPLDNLTGRCVQYHYEQCQYWLSTCLFYPITVYLSFLIQSRTIKTLKNIQKKCTFSIIGPDIRIPTLNLEQPWRLLCHVISKCWRRYLNELMKWTQLHFIFGGTASRC